LGSKVAIKGMMEQGSGSVYNMEGFGSDGRMMHGMSVYGTSKKSVSYFTRSLIREYKSTPVSIGSISPGMVVTDMLLDPLRRDLERNQRALKVFHTLADEAEKIAPWIASQIVAHPPHGTRIAWLTKRKIMFRFFWSMFKKRKVKGLPDY
jgi:short-subunit dehydrogenase